MIIVGGNWTRTSPPTQDPSAHRARPASRRVRRRAAAVAPIRAVGEHRLAHHVVIERLALVAAVARVVARVVRDRLAAARPSSPAGLMLGPRPRELDLSVVELVVNAAQLG